MQIVQHGRRLAIGDIHGGYRSMVQVLERARFDAENDLLIGLGDYVDGWPDTYDVVSYLMGLKNFTGVIGNHDLWFVGEAAQIIRRGINKDELHYLYEPDWVSQGGEATLLSYARHVASIDSHARFLASLPGYLVVGDKLFIHGGCPDWKNLGTALSGCSTYDLAWDRRMFHVFLRCGKDHPPVLGGFSECYIGHTSTSSFDATLKPVHCHNLWNIDQGGGWEGKLTLMDIDTHEYWQSDIVRSLYPGR